MGTQCLKRTKKSDEVTNVIFIFVLEATISRSEIVSQFSVEDARVSSP